MSDLVMEGWVHKRGNRIKTWRRRWMEVYPGILRYFTAKGGTLKGEISLAGVTVREATDAEAKQMRRLHCLVLDTPGRAFLVDTTSAAQRPMWKRSLENASGSGSVAAAAPADSHSDDDDDDGDDDSAEGTETRLRSASEQPAALDPLQTSPKRGLRAQSLVSEASLAAGGGGASSPGGSRLSAALHAAGQLPEVMDIDGPPETGSELRVRSDGNKLDSLCCAWFRIRPGSGGWELAFPLQREVDGESGVEAEAAGALAGDLDDEAVLAAIAGMGVEGLRAAFQGEAADGPATPPAPAANGHGLADNPAAFLAPGRRTPDPQSCLLRLELIPNATRQTYTPTSTDVDCLIGCFAQPASGGGAHCVVADRPVALVSEDEVAVRIRLQPHTHHKFCDRRRRVCTAVGRYREGEVLLATLRGPLQRTHRLVWERSERFPHVYPRIGLPESGSGAGAGDAAEAAGGGASDHRELATPSSAPVSLPSSALEGVRFDRVPARPVAHLPPTPAAHEPSPAFASLLKGRRSKRSSSRVEPGAAGTIGRYPLFRADVGRMIRCRLVPVEDSGSEEEGGEGAEAVSLPVGPIEPAPPRVRECWIDGVPAVDRLLVGRHWYYGGFEGLTTAEWVRVDEEGETTTVKGPAAIPPGAPLPVPTAEAEATPEVLSHPCVLQLTAADVGCVFKFKAQPARSDADSGHVATSRPTREVEAESQREWVPPVVEPGSLIAEAGVY